MTRVILVIIRFYQQYVSPMKQQSCRFIPTCSEYAVEAVKKYGARRGGWMSVKRVLRCNPFCKTSGYDPVP